MAELLCGDGEIEADDADCPSVEDRLATLLALVRIQVRAGECRAALRTAARCARIAVDTDWSNWRGTGRSALAAAASCFRLHGNDATTVPNIESGGQRRVRDHTESARAS